jgi:hypothetical protein
MEAGSKSFISAFWRKQYALPVEHGAWVWLLGPFALGVAAAGRLTAGLLPLLGAALAVFVLRQPVTIAVKAVSGRRTRQQFWPALAWAVVYTFIATALLSPLLLGGQGRLLWLGVPGLLVFGWHLRLVQQRRERRRPGVEILAAGALALSAPAAYWVAGGASNWIGLLLWGIGWFQAAASIVHVYLRLEQRQRSEPPPLRTRLAEGTRSLAYHGFNLGASLMLATVLGLSWLLPMAFLLTGLDALDGVLRPATGARPAAIGMRQLLASAGFFTLASAAFLLG